MLSVQLSGTQAMILRLTVNCKFCKTSQQQSTGRQEKHPITVKIQLLPGNCEDLYIFDNGDI